jgi:hypothetical protein
VACVYNVCISTYYIHMIKPHTLEQRRCVALLYLSIILSIIAICGEIYRLFPAHIHACAQRMHDSFYARCIYCNRGHHIAHKCGANVDYYHARTLEYRRITERHFTKIIQIPGISDIVQQYIEFEDEAPISLLTQLHYAWICHPRWSATLYRVVLHRGLFYPPL